MFRHVSIVYVRIVCVMMYGVGIMYRYLFM